MTDRLPLAQHTKASLDALYERAERAEQEASGYAEADSADAAAGSYAHRAEDAEEAVAGLAQAIRLTREYVGADLLPAVEGWDWYDALRRWAPHELGADTLTVGLTLDEARAIRDNCAADLREDQREDQRAGRAEAAVREFLATLLPVRSGDDIIGYGPPLPIEAAAVDRWRAALDEEQPERGVHIYLSTGCWHGDHAYCQAMTGLNGAKRPASCKKRGARCICLCHQQAAPPVHIGGQANAEDCPACAGTNPPYPFICPGPDAAADAAGDLVGYIAPTPPIGCLAVTAEPPVPRDPCPYCESSSERVPRALMAEHVATVHPEQQR